jgi:hypothetical protein
MFSFQMPSSMVNWESVRETSIEEMLPDICVVYERGRDELVSDVLNDSRSSLIVTVSLYLDLRVIVFLVL